MSHSTQTVLDERTDKTYLRRVDDQSSVIGLLWQRRRFIFRFSAAIIVLTTIAASLWPARYQSTTRVLPPDSSNSMMAAALARSAPGGMGMMAGDLLGMKNPGATYLAILRSRTVLDHLIQRFDLQKIYWDRTMKDARQDLARFTDLEEDRKSGVITVTVTDRSAQRAAALANAYVEELNKVSADLNTTAAHRERLFLEERLHQVKAELDDAARKLAQFSSANGTLDVRDQGKAMLEAAATLQGNLIAAESELRGLQQIYTDNNPRVQSLQARVAELRRNLNKMNGTSAATDQGAYPSLRRLPLLGVTYSDLYRTVKVQETVYELLTQQFELAKVQEAKELPVVRVLDPADVPERRSSPKRGMLILLSMLFGPIVAGALVILKAYWRSLDEADHRKALVMEAWRYTRQPWWRT